jgi:hypothetical protein
MVKIFAEQLIGAEIDTVCSAGHGERSEDRVNRRNGSRESAWDTRTGTIALQVPKPGGLLLPRVAARAPPGRRPRLRPVVAECYVPSTRRGTWRSGLSRAGGPGVQEPSAGRSVLHLRLDGRASTRRVETPRLIQQCARAGGS